MNPVDLARAGLWVLSTVLGSFAVFCLYFVVTIGAAIGGHAFVCLAAASAIALALDKTA